MLLVVLSSDAAAQSGESAEMTEATETAEVPFGAGERAEYKVTLGIFGSVGEGAMEILGIEEIRGRPTYHLRLTVKGRVLFASVDDRLESWLDSSSLIAHRFEQDQKEPTTKRHRVYDFYPQENRWMLTDLREETEEEDEMSTDEPLDEVSFLYFARTLPLEVGETYTFDRYFRDERNPVILKVLRRETIEVPAGTFDTIVVQPIIKSRGLFSEGGQAEVYFTDDERRMLVQMKSRVPVLGSLSLHLENFTPGKVAFTDSAPARPSDRDR